MAKYCPIEKRKVIYLVCQECEDKQCKYILKEKVEEKEKKK